MQFDANVRVPMIVSFLLGVFVLWGHPAGVQAEPAARPVLPPKAELAKLPPDGGPDSNWLVFELYNMLHSLRQRFLPNSEPMDIYLSGNRLNSVCCM